MGELHRSAPGHRLAAIFHCCASTLTGAIRDGHQRLFQIPLFGRACATAKRQCLMVGLASGLGHRIGLCGAIVVWSFRAALSIGPGFTGAALDPRAWRAVTCVLARSGFSKPERDDGASLHGLATAAVQARIGRRGFECSKRRSVTPIADGRRHCAGMGLAARHTGRVFGVGLRLGFFGGSCCRRACLGRAVLVAAGLACLSPATLRAGPVCADAPAQRQLVGCSARSLALAGVAGYLADQRGASVAAGKAFPAATRV